ncbi:transposase [Tritrichomonas foetus]|uniref:Transposase n=1 Tax=Tritrichomonas foetus TaxID=1144522 RepID=A0A1J4KYB0_9EUKA|nr:transposase [Tritrichomonas foetus]|eukprot:OHT16243.1 transposase [Tritrichomonas foetus]
MLTELQKFKRVSFAYSMIKNELCRNILFSDESRFSLGPDNRWVYRRYGDEHPAIFAERQKFNNGIMIFGAIGENFKSRLIFTEKTVDQKSYIQSISQNGLLDDMNNHFGVCNYIFQQDGAPALTGRLSTTYLKYHLNYLKIWPANSPDINVIENIWGIMKKNIKCKKCSNNPRIKRNCLSNMGPNLHRNHQ